jgi:hypothetical protein
MAWTAPMTFADNTALTAAQLNTHLRDNLLETMPGKATTEGAYFVTQSDNSIVERVAVTARVSASEGTSSTSYVDLATVGPSVTFESGSNALVFHAAHLANDNLNAQSIQSWAISGDTTRGALDEIGIIVDGIAAGNQWALCSMDLLTTLNEGTNTITCKYRAGGAGTMQASDRFLAVLPL